MATIRLLGPATIRPGETFTVSALCRDDSDEPEAGLVVSCAIRRVSDGQWWDASLSIWDVVKTLVTMPAVDAADLPGVYSTEFTHEDLDPGKDESDYFIEVTSDAVGAPSNPRDIIFVQAWFDLKTLKIGDNQVADPVLPSPLVTTFDLLRALKALLVQDTQLDDESKTLKVFDENGAVGANVVAEFNVSDAAGFPSIREVMRRYRT